MATVGVVVRKDGTIPFDTDVHPQHRKAILDFAKATFGALAHAGDCLGGEDHSKCTCEPHISPA